MKIRLIISFVSIFCSFSIGCMDKKKLPSDILPNLIRVFVEDGTFALEKWKILQTKSLMPYLTDETEMPEFFIPIRSMRLFSNALEVNPGNNFKQHVNSLSPKEYDQLVTVVEKQDKDKKPQLDALLLRAQLVDAAGFPASVYAKIRSYMNRLYVTSKGDLKSSFIDNMIRTNVLKNALPYRKLSSKVATLGCYESKVSRPSLVRKSSDCFVSKAMVLDGIEWTGRGGMIIDQGRKLQLTPFEPNILNYAWDGKTYLLWLLDASHNVLSKTMLSCEDAENLSFSSNGHSLMTYTGDKVSISSIILANNIVSIAKTLTFYHKHSAKIQGICPGRTLRKIVAWSFNNVQSFVSIWNGLGSIIAELEFTGAQIVQVELNRDESRLLIRTIPVITGKQMVRIYDTSNVLKIRLLTELSQESFEPAVYGRLGDMWMIATGEHTITFIRNTANGCDLKTYPTELQGYFVSRPVLAACSPDNRLFVGVIPGSLSNTIKIWSALTGDIISTFYNGSENVKTMQIMPDNRSLLYKISREKSGTYRYYKQLLYSDEDAQALEHIMKNASIAEWVVLWRLLWANNNEEIVELYPEEPAYKIVQALAKKSSKVHMFIHKYLFWKVKANNSMKNKSVKKRATFFA